MLLDSSNDSLISRLLSQKPEDALKLLQSQDEKWIKFKKTQILRLAPTALTSLLQEDAVDDQTFLSGWKRAKQPYTQAKLTEQLLIISTRLEKENEKADISEIKHQSITEKQLQTGQAADSEREIPLSRQSSLSKLSEGSEQNRSKAISIGQGRQRSMAPKQSPFITAGKNLRNPFANSQSLGQTGSLVYCSPHQSASNFAAMMYRTKPQTFTNSQAYPTSIMTGMNAHPLHSTFSTGFKTDVSDVLRYTLGRETDAKKTQKPENPFMRRPPKFQQTQMKLQ